jgi:hypothetical protein
VTDKREQRSALQVGFLSLAIIGGLVVYVHYTPPNRETAQRNFGVQNSQGAQPDHAVGRSVAAASVVAASVEQLMVTQEADNDTHLTDAKSRLATTI